MLRPFCIALQSDDINQDNVEYTRQCQHRSHFYRYVCMKMTLQGGKSHCEKEFSKTKAGQEIFTLSQVSGRGAVFIGG